LPQGSRDIFDPPNGRGRRRGRQSNFRDGPPRPPSPTADEQLDELIRIHEARRRARSADPNARRYDDEVEEEFLKIEDANSYPRGAGAGPMAVPLGGFARSSRVSNPGRPPSQQEQMAAITYRAPRGQAQQSRLAQQALPMNQRGQVDTGDPEDAQLIEAKQQAMRDRIEAVRNASTRRGASSSGYNPPPKPTSKPRLTKKTPADQTA
jgi:hypothetical protein